MLLIYTPTITPRLSYTLQFIFGEVLKCEYQITTEQVNHQGQCICYDDVSTADFVVNPSGLLFEEGVRPQALKPSKHNNQTVLFSTNGNGYTFDIFSAVFYLISRYEEYLPHEKDLYGRFPYQQSVAHQEDFLKYPLVNFWLNDFAIALKQAYPEWNYIQSEFNYVPTFDVDMAWSFKNKGFLRNLGGWLSNPDLKRLKVLSGNEKDPYDSFEWINAQTKKELKPLYFILAANERSKFDKNIPLKHPAMQGLIKKLKQHQIGIHPSYESSVQLDLIEFEKKNLEAITNSNITKSRQHYLKFDLPNTYRALIAAGITDEYSMGYGTINGFRASTANSFLWYDLEKESVTNLRVHPFCFMDANSIFEQKFNADETFSELRFYVEQCRLAKGTLITIFHNHLLGDDYPAYKKVYQTFLEEISF